MASTRGTRQCRKSADTHSRLEDHAPPWLTALAYGAGYGLIAAACFSILAATVSHLAGSNNGERETIRVALRYYSVISKILAPAGALFMVLFRSVRRYENAEADEPAHDEDEHPADPPTSPTSHRPRATRFEREQLIARVLAIDTMPPVAIGAARANPVASLDAPPALAPADGSSSRAAASSEIDPADARGNEPADTHTLSTPDFSKPTHGGWLEQLHVLTVEADHPRDPHESAEPDRPAPHQSDVEPLEPVLSVGPRPLKLPLDMPRGAVRRRLVFVADRTSPMHASQTHHEPASGDGQYLLFGVLDPAIASLRPGDHRVSPNDVQNPLQCGAERARPHQPALFFRSMWRDHTEDAHITAEQLHLFAASPRAGRSRQLPLLQCRQPLMRQDQASSPLNLSDELDPRSDEQPHAEAIADSDRPTRCPGQRLLFDRTYAATPLQLPLFDPSQPHRIAQAPLPLRTPKRTPETADHDDRSSDGWSMAA